MFFSSTFRFVIALEKVILMMESPTNCKTTDEWADEWTNRLERRMTHLRFPPQIIKSRRSNSHIFLNSLTLRLSLPTLPFLYGEGRSLFFILMVFIPLLQSSVAIFSVTIKDNRKLVCCHLYPAICSVAFQSSLFNWARKRIMDAWRLSSTLIILIGEYSDD